MVPLHKVFRGPNEYLVLFQQFSSIDTIEWFVEHRIYAVFVIIDPAHDIAGRGDLFRQQLFLFGKLILPIQAGI